MNTTDQKTISLGEINIVLSETLIKVVERKISPRQAMTISRLALALSKNIVNNELKERIESIERVLGSRL